MDRIFIHDLRLRCVLGVGEEERRERQEVLVQLVFHTDLSGPAGTDRIGDALDYKEVKKGILEMVEDSSFHLAETLAERIAEKCLLHPMMEEVVVTVEKPGALRFARSVGVHIVRSRVRPTVVD